MATKRTPGSRPGLIRCENCGEEYSSTYRYCPFCDEFDEYEGSAAERQPAQHGGGKRLTKSRRRGGGYTRTSPFQILAILVSLAVILAAIWIVFAKLKPLMDRGDVDTVDPNSNSQQTEISPAPDASPEVTPDDESGDEEPAVTPEQPEVGTTPGTGNEPAMSAAVGFTLNKTDFSFTDKYPDPVILEVTFSPEGSTAVLTWSSSNTEVASVDANGKISHGTRKGTATITAEMSNGIKQTCKVHNQVAGGTTTTPEPTTSTTPSSYSINNADFTFYRVGESYKLKVVDYSGGVTWSSSNTSVATVGSDGLCKAVATGTCTVTGTLDDGSTVKAIVRVKIS